MAKKRSVFKRNCQKVNLKNRTRTKGKYKNIKIPVAKDKFPAQSLEKKITGNMIMDVKIDRCALPYK